MLINIQVIDQRVQSSPFLMKDMARPYVVFGEQQSRHTLKNKIILIGRYAKISSARSAKSRAKLKTALVTRK